MKLADLQPRVVRRLGMAEPLTPGQRLERRRLSHRAYNRKRDRLANLMRKRVQ